MYPFLRKGNRLPSVTAVQILINRKMKQGSYITVDGIYGPNTRKAVVEFQARRGLDDDGIVGEKTWGALIAGQSLQVVDTVDVTNPGDIGVEDEDIRWVGGKPIVNFGMCGGIRKVVMDIEARAHSKSIVILRFHGHGSPGYMGVSSGVDDEVSSELGVTYLDSLAKFLSRLAPVFSPFGSAELHGCRVGAGPDGQKLLTALAWAWRVPVTAGVRTQYGGGSSTFRFEGPTFSAFPGSGDLKSWSRSINADGVYGMSVGP